MTPFGIASRNRSPSRSTGRTSRNHVFQVASDNCACNAVVADSHAWAAAVRRRSEISTAPSTCVENRSPHGTGVHNSAVGLVINPRFPGQFSHRSAALSGRWEGDRSRHPRATQGSSPEHHDCNSLDEVALSPGRRLMRAGREGVIPRSRAECRRRYLRAPTQPPAAMEARASDQPISAPRCDACSSDSKLPPFRPSPPCSRPSSLVPLGAISLFEEAMREADLPAQQPEA